MLTKAQLDVLSALSEPMTISELAAALDRSDSHVSRLVNDLEEQLLVTSHRDGRAKVVEPAGYEAVRLYRDLVQRHPHIDFPDLLQGTAIELLYFLDEPHTVSELAERTDNYRNTVHRVLTRLRNRGLLSKRDGTFVLTDAFETLNRFARAIVTHRHIVATPASAATIVWETVDEFLIETEDPIDDEAFTPTGPRRFADVGVPLVPTDRRHYVFGDRHDTLSVEDLVCHTLLVDDGPRYRSYCLLVLATADWDEATLRDRATHYGVSEAVDDLRTYLETRGEDPSTTLPSWAAFTRLAAEYDIEL